MRMVELALDTPPSIADFEDPNFNPFTAAKDLGGERRVTNPFPEYHRLRAISPVYHGDIKQRFGLPADLTLTGYKNHFWILSMKEARPILMDSVSYSASAYMPVVGLYFGPRSVTIMD